MRRIAITTAFTVITLVLLSMGAACTDDDTSPAATSTVATEATAVTEDFDYNKLSAIVLRPEDLLSEVFAATSGFSPGGSGGGVSFTTWYGDDSLLIQSTVGRYPDPVKRELDFDHIRRSIATLTGNETNFDLPGADLAFNYAPSGQVFSNTILAFKGEYFMLIVTQSGDGTRLEEAGDAENIAAYARTVFTRLEGLVADPDSVTPIEGAAQYATPTTGVPVTTPEAILPTLPAADSTPVAP